MTGSITYRKKLVGTEFVEVPAYYLDGEEVSAAKYAKAFPDQGVPTGQQRGGKYPHESMALGVHPRDRKKAAVHAAKVGVPTDFSADGKAIMRDRGHRRAYMRAMGAHSLNAYGRV